MSGRVYWPTLPSDFPQDYVLADGGGCWLYVKCRWPSKHADNLWEMGCLHTDCTYKGVSVLSTDELHTLMKDGRVIGTYKNGIIVTQGQ